MTFITAVAGPSRLPWRAITPSLSSAARPRHATTDAASAEDASAPVEAAPIEPELEDKNSKTARIKEKQFYGTKEGYQAWIKTGAASEFFQANKGQRARWLDPNLPYPTNPSFRPPPPISNELQNTIYRQLKKSSRTVGQIAEQYNVSKARIEAIRKLKQVEDEFRRQEIPLQQAFHDGMEPLLGVEIQSRVDSTKQSVVDRQNALRREEIPGTSIEREEEDRLDAGIGRGGAFATMSQEQRTEGIERTVWEFRSEEMVMAEREAEAKAAAVAETPAEKVVAEQEAAPETPDHVHAGEGAVKARKEFPSRTVKPGKSKIRFVDTSR